ncbi:hypothetical protein [Deinococcus fonticola]|nr:hypothetical protein [Deinococcus fonticola]
MRRPRSFWAAVLLALAAVLLLDWVGWPAWSLAGSAAVLFVRAWVDF